VQVSSPLPGQGILISFKVHPTHGAHRDDTVRPFGPLEQGVG